MSLPIQPEMWVGGEIIYHQDRKHYYQIINKVTIKCRDNNGDVSWCDGWNYVRVSDVYGNQTCFEVECDPDKFQIFCRPNELFDSNWTQIGFGNRPLL